MPQTSFSTFIHLIIILVNRFVSEQFKLSSISFSRGEKKNGWLYRKHFTELLECILHPYFGIPGQSTLALFISTYLLMDFQLQIILRTRIRMLFTAM